MYELLLLTIIAAPPANTIIESQAIETGMTLADCTRMSSEFRPIPIQLPTGQRLTYKLSCEKARDF